MGIYKSVWWMPWFNKVMKDAAWRRNASGRCLATGDPKMSEWGNLSSCQKMLYKLCMAHTQGSKTFQYLEEKKQIVFPE